MKKIFMCIVFMSFVSVVAVGQDVKICDDGAEWPPYMYYERVNGEINTQNIIGAVKELFDEAFMRSDLTYSVELIPWKRCMAEVENFDKTQNYEVFSNGGYSPQRTELYWPSIPLYVTHRGVFYSEKKYPQGPPITTKADVVDYKICGVLGYDYADILEWGDNITIYQGAKSNDAVLQQIDKGRCDIMITSMEPIYGAVAIGKYTIPEGIRSFPMPGLTVSTFHFWVSKKSPRAFELVTRLNTAIMEVIYTQDYTRIFTKYLPDVPHLYE